MKLSNKILISTAVCGLMSLSLQAKQAAKTDAKKPAAAATTDPKGNCHGVNKGGNNGCHGNAAYGDANNGCAGSAPDGKGWVEMTKSECAKAKGKFEPTK